MYCTRYLLPCFQSTPINLIKFEDIIQLLEKMEKGPRRLGPSALNRCLITFRTIFNHAIKRKIPGALDNPATGIKTRAEVQREVHLTPEECEQLLFYVRHHGNHLFRTAIELILLTGARRNEIGRAEWRYVDWANKILYVPDAKPGARRIVLSEPALVLLKSLPRAEGNPYLFPARAPGKPSGSLFTPWSKVRKAAGFPNLRIHDLRHTFASLAVNSGSSLYIVQGLLGHKKPSTTQRYAHLSQETLHNAASKIGNIFVDRDRRVSIG